MATFEDESAQRAADFLNSHIHYNPSASVRDQLVEMFQQQDRPAAKRALAERMAAERGISFKSARDTITRYERGQRKPAARNESRTKAAVRTQQVRSILDRRRIGIKLNGTFVVSTKPWKGQIKLDLSGQAKDDFVQAMNDGNTDKAISIILNKYDRNFERTVTVTNISGLVVTPKSGE